MLCTLCSTVIYVLHGCESGELLGRVMPQSVPFRAACGTVKWNRKSKTSRKYTKAAIKTRKIVKITSLICEEYRR